MKKFLCISLLLVAGCASSPSSENATEDAEVNLPKAAPAPGLGERIYRNESPPEEKNTAVQTKLEPKPGASCETPLGTIPDGGKATGFLQATVPEDEVCISDTLTCNDGKWSGDAIHPKCKVQK